MKGIYNDYIFPSPLVIFSCNFSMSPLILSMPESWRQPSIRSWNHLKLNSMNSYMATGKHLLILGGCVPSINPQQWDNGAPLFDIAEAKVSRLTWDSQRWSKLLTRWAWFAYTSIIFKTSLKIYDSSYTGRLNMSVRSSNLFGYAKRLKRIQRASIPLSTVRFRHIIWSGILILCLSIVSSL